MKHLTSEIICRFCAHRFTVCVHVASTPDVDAEYTFPCPSNASRLTI